MSNPGVSNGLTLISEDRSWNWRRKKAVEIIDKKAPGVPKRCSSATQRSCVKTTGSATFWFMAIDDRGPVRLCDTILYELPALIEQFDAIIGEETL